MALSPAERQRRRRERKKAEEARARDETVDIAKTTFAEFMTDSCWDAINFDLGLCGLRIEPFTDETSAKEVAAEFDEWGAGEGYYDAYVGSAGRAEMLVECLISAASQLAHQLKTYKLAEINAAITRLENLDLSDPATKKRALADIVRLNKMRDRLNKEVRRPFPQWQVKGD